MAATARDTRYSGRSAVYGNLAYDLDREVREHELRHAGEAPRRREAAAPQKAEVRRISQEPARQRQRVPLLSAAGFAAAVGLAILLLMNYIQLTQISTQVVALKSTLAQLETEHVTLTTQYEQMFDLTTIQQTAESTGMAKASPSQIYYVDMSQGDSAVVYRQEETSVLSRLLTSLHHGVYAVVEYFE